MEHPIQSVTIRKNETGAGWFMLVKPQGQPEMTTGCFPIIDPTILMAEASRWAAKMALGREVQS